MPSTAATGLALRWLWDAVDVLLPSFYAMSLNASYNEMTTAKNIAEARRVQAALLPGVRKPIYFYSWYYPWDCHSCHDTPQRPNCTVDPDDGGNFARTCFNTPEMMRSQINTPAASGIDGVIMWGAGSDVYTPTHCAGLRKFIVETMGPMVESVRNQHDRL